MKSLPLAVFFLHFFILGDYFAQSQVVDHSFGQKGDLLINNKDFGQPEHYLTGIQVFPDGSCLMAANYSLPRVNYSNSGYAFAVIKLQQNGQYDSTFGTDGIRIIPIAATAYMQSMMIQPDGKILLYGSAQGYNISMVRLLANGTPDSSFNKTGILNTWIGLASNYTLHTIKIRADGKYYVVGSRIDNLNITLLNTDGSVNDSFGFHGTVASNTISNLSNEGVEAVVHNDNSLNIFYSLYPQTTSKYVFQGFRLNSNGKPDSSFGVNGYCDYPQMGQLKITQFFPAVDDKCYILAQTSPGNGTNVVARLNARTGDPDSSFGVSGRFEIIDRQPIGMAMRPDSTFLINSRPNSGGSVGVMAVTKQGFIDNSFGVNGLISYNLTPLYNYNFSQIGTNNQKIVVAGTVNDTTGQFLLRQFDLNGNVDISFGNNGIYQFTHGGSYDRISGVIEQPGKKFLVAGITQNYYWNLTNWYFKRYNSDGTIDLSFGNQGIVVSKENGFIINDVVVLPNYDFLVAGSHTSGYMIRKYKVTGIIDSSFGVNGVADPTALFPNEGSINISNLAVQPDGKIIYSAGGANYKMYIGRLTATGIPDVSFGNNGLLIISNPFSMVWHEGTMGGVIILTPDNKIIVAGTATTNNYKICHLVRVLGNGTLDSDFGTNGHARFDQANSNASISVCDALMQPDGKIVLLYKQKQNSGNYYHGGGVVRFLPNGFVDSLFGQECRYYLPGIAYKLQLQNDGRILVGGLINNKSVNSDVTNMYVLRVRSDGKTDSTFGSSGMIINRNYYAVNNDRFPAGYGSGTPTPAILYKSAPGSYFYGGTIAYKAEDGFLQHIQVQENDFPAQQIKVADTAADPGCKRTRIDWVTTNETGSDYFVIERSIDTIYFKPIAAIRASGNTNGTVSYSYIDTVSDGSLYNYRVQLLSKGGACIVSNRVTRKADFISPGTIQQPGLVFQNDAGVRQHVISWKIIKQQVLNSVILQRKTNNGSFTNFAVIPPLQAADTVAYAYTDNALQIDSAYSYRVVITGNNCIIITSAVVSNRVTGLFDLPQDVETLVVYPNPVNRELYITVPASLYNGQLIVYSIDGKPVLTQKITNNGASFIPVNMQSLANGTYYIKLFGGKKIWLGKISKL
ncbi:T9SS type A sorting domain-containing protein [Niastella populi]|uniref:Secretion system C-terminal sorting domain-containing protein n=1 Tax=Niastella populi TaxID=550983 RepID=A0A1V9FPG3_9BACT|nr:T9SS type A sorting domain-containing protein [Niastella populi]OQP60253.1 hypothetical protein A4R26_20060 [Niastella populi]